MGCHTVTPVAERHRRHRMVWSPRPAGSARPLHESDAELATVPRSAADRPAGQARGFPSNEHSDGTEEIWKGDRIWSATSGPLATAAMFVFSWIP